MNTPQPFQEPVAPSDRNYCLSRFFAAIAESEVFQLKKRIAEGLATKTQDKTSQFLALILY